MIVTGWNSSDSESDHSKVPPQEPPHKDPRRLPLQCKRYKPKSLRPVTEEGGGGDLMGWSTEFVKHFIRTLSPSAPPTQSFLSRPGSRLDEGPTLHTSVFSSIISKPYWISQYGAWVNNEHWQTSRGIHTWINTRTGQRRAKHHLCVLWC